MSTPAQRAAFRLLTSHPVTTHHAEEWTLPARKHREAEKRSADLVRLNKRIRELHAYGKYTYRQIADFCGCSEPTVWRHINGEVKRL